MLNDISRLAVANPIGPPDYRSSAVTVAQPDAAVARPTKDPQRAWDRATQIAASAMFAGRDVEVTSFHDQGSGRFVCKVADRTSGEVLMQSPPDALLRFFASTRDALAEPLLALEA